MNRTQTQNAALMLRQLSTQDFLAFGHGQIAYIRPGLEEGRNVFKLYSANGSLLATQETAELAWAAAHYNGLETVSVQ